MKPSSWALKIETLPRGACRRARSNTARVGESAFPYRGHLFSVVPAREELWLALLLNAVNPAIGGVLVRGGEDAARSTAARGIRELLPLAAGGGKPAFVDFPTGATEDAVIGSLGFDGEPCFRPGLLARAHEGVLYIGEVNRLDGRLIDGIFDAAENGENVIERAGRRLRHPSRFVLIGAMNPEADEPSPRLLDRFGLAVSFDGGPLERRADDAAFRRRIAAARERLPEVIVPVRLVGFIDEICLRNRIAGHRAGLAVARAARAHAAWRGRLDVSADDILSVAPM
ncbi:MAG: ATP-binding protein, partial [Candidatus Accumulibacter sp.]|nr:ATP-binding protein [Accumulibacter sp.]